MQPSPPTPTRWTAALIAVVTLLVGAGVGGAQEADRKLPRDYKRVHLRALEKVEKDKAEEAVTDLLAFLEKYPDDTETHYVLALAHCANDNRDAARATMERAIDLGVFPGRFVGVLADRFALLHDEPAYQELVQRFDHEPVNGPMLGRPTADSVSVWLRTRQAAEVWVMYGPNSDLSDSEVVQATTTPETGFTAILPMNGLVPGRTYHYALLIGEDRRSFLPTRQFRMPAAEPDSLRIAFGGGAGFVPTHEGIWDRIRDVQPDLVLLLGDNVYIDHPRSPLIQDYCYDRRHGRPEFRRMIQSIAIDTIWDDHDFGTNDCHGGPEVEQPAWKRDVWNRYRRWWLNPERDDAGSAPGCYHDFAFHGVHFVMLDGRYYRTSPKAEGPASMLGPVQLQWLFDSLASSQERFHALVSPVPWTFFAKGNSPDTWNGYRDERDRILDFLDQEQLPGVVLLSADRHRSDRWVIPRDDSRPFHEFNSSRLTNIHTHQPVPQSEFSYNKRPSFGVVEFDRSEDTASVTYRIVNLEGEEVYRHTLPVAELDR